MRPVPRKCSKEATGRALGPEERIVGKEWPRARLVREGELRCLWLYVYLPLIVGPLKKTWPFAFYFIHNMSLSMFKIQSCDPLPGRWQRGRCGFHTGLSSALTVPRGLASWSRCWAGFDANLSELSRFLDISWALNCF